MQILGTAASGLRAQQLSLDLTADNMANVNTPGYKAAEMDFAEALAVPAAGATRPGSVSAGAGTAGGQVDLGTGVLERATGRNLAQGDIYAAANPLDLAIEGAGYFRVALPNGQIAYTRAGAFRLDANRQIVDSRGHALVPGVKLPPGSGALTVTADGQIKVTDLQGREQTVGQIELAAFPNPESLQDIGNNLLLPQANTGPVQTGRPGATAGNAALGFIHGGALEQSNVSLADTMADLVKVQRAYQLNARMVEDGDQMWAIADSIRA
ncbi:Flagella basal body rod protein [Acididesulfobacillus acetoxydans]|uniref:Flagella basal body rod protein n=1 Tax=Acididesulfobacillus acetoxydans TaxID=1561005 RepID=A0A8S0X6Z6_9FIRM|nr:flagellar hook-basal body protein [Acididesulfobacillus acetoxydans]CAA7602910.1 Flagella basal body rod protein [Acididesulfobacillus acetoxydans]CEJ05791.1 Flagellar basal-body rod protein FlgG [Acididesulfobacillus acetoxydans]